MLDSELLFAAGAAGLWHLHASSSHVPPTLPSLSVIWLYTPVSGG